MKDNSSVLRVRLKPIDPKIMDHDYSTHRAFIASCLRRVQHVGRSSGKSTQIMPFAPETQIMWPDRNRVDIDFRLAQRRRDGTLYGIWCRWMIRGVLPFYERPASESDYSFPFIRALREWVDTAKGLRPLSSCAWEWMKGAESVGMQVNSRMHLAHAASTLLSSLIGAGPTRVGSGCPPPQFDHPEQRTVPMEEYGFFQLWPYHRPTLRLPYESSQVPPLRLEAGVFPDVYTLLQWASAIENARGYLDEGHLWDLEPDRLKAYVDVMSVELKEQLYGLKAVNDLADIIHAEAQAVMRTPEGLAEPWIALQVWESTFPVEHPYTPLVREWAGRLIREDDEKVAEGHKKYEEKWRPTRSGRSFL